MPKYLVVGAGGVGAPLAAALSKNIKDVCLIARGENLRAINERGLKLIRGGESETVFVNAASGESYSEKADVIFVCVKHFSIASILPVIKSASHENTVVVSLLNGIYSHRALEQGLDGTRVAAGCVYINAGKTAPGEVTVHGRIFKITFGFPGCTERTGVLAEAERELCDCGIVAAFSNNIMRDIFRKFTFVSPMAAAGLYYNCEAEQFQQPSSPQRELFCTLIRELERLARALGVDLGQDMVKANLEIMDGLLKSAGTSMQRDIAAGRKSEIDVLIFSVASLAREHGLRLEEYEQLSRHFKHNFA